VNGSFNITLLCSNQPPPLQYVLWLGTSLTHSKITVIQKQLWQKAYNYEFN